MQYTVRMVLDLIPYVGNQDRYFLRYTGNYVTVLSRNLHSNTDALGKTYVIYGGIDI